MFSSDLDAKFRFDSPVRSAFDLDLAVMARLDSDSDLSVASAFDLDLAAMAGLDSDMVAIRLENHRKKRLVDDSKVARNQTPP